MAWCAFLSFTVAAVNVGVQLAKAPFRDRAAAPQRAVALLAITVLAVEAAFTAGALVDFEQLRHNGLGAATRHKEEEEDDDDEGESSGSNGDGDKSNDDVVPWKRKLCLAQGATFQWAVHAMVLVFLWFQYAQYRKLVQREAPEESNVREPIVIAGIAFLASAVTAGAAWSGNIAPRNNFYSCWVDGPYFSAYYGLVGGALLLANFLCFKSVRWLDHVHLTLGANERPEARQLLLRYKVANLALLVGALYLIAVIFISFQEPHSQALCFLVSFDILLLPVLFALFAQGFTSCGCFSGEWLRNVCCTLCNKSSYEMGDGMERVGDSITESDGGRLRANPGSLSNGSRWSGFTAVDDRDSYRSNYTETATLPTHSSVRSCGAISNNLSSNSGGNGGSNGTREDRTLSGRDAMQAQYSEPLLSGMHSDANDADHDTFSRAPMHNSSGTPFGASDGEIGASSVDMDARSP